MYLLSTTVQLKAELNPERGFSFPAGQIYVAEEKVNSDYYHASVFTHDPYANHKLVTGNDEYYRIHFNHRYVFVKASDVEVVSQR
ncbi:hypothetical protein GCM10007416_24580 [Kroppenstedtia guangzhouensis]|uniref:Uncharacterized protein n=1 Tax=Kroppenstedtia guangzhouensis TaxID=1274356 RepID=A0ABQ1GUT6_9BACL|nr:hypothetical protein GCM10007416_24580 [Kroppenstedtia guangzhouensis]